MSEDNAKLILRELDIMRRENKDDHAEIKKHAEHTNGTVAELVKWKIQVRTVLWIMGVLMGGVVIPTFVNLLTLFLKNHF